MQRLFLVTFVGLLAPAGAFAQAVQLPTFHQFGVSTTVVVPDRGSVSMGGVQRSAMGTSRFGFPGYGGSRASGVATSTGGVRVSAQIHDFEAMDRALLDYAAALRGHDDADHDPRFRSIESHGVPSLAEIRRRRLEAAEQDHAEALQLIRQADRAAASGHLGAAKVFLQMAARRTTGELQQKVLQRLRSHQTSSTH